MHITPWIEKVLSKHWGVLKCWGAAFEMVGLRKKNVALKELCVFGTLMKNLCAVGFLERVFFHCVMFCVTNLGIVLDVCTGRVGVFIKKIWIKFIQDPWLWIVKDTQDEHFNHVDQIMPRFSSSKAIKKWSIVKKIPHTRDTNYLDVCGKYSIANSWV